MNILLTSAGRRGYIVDYFKQALNGRGRVHASNSIMSPALLHADQYTITPLIYDDTYIEYLLNYADANGIKAIVPLFDIDLPVLAQAKDRFKDQGIEVVVSDYHVTQICNDKWETHNFLIKHNLNSPHTFLSLNDAQDAIRAEVVHFPLIIKPRWGMGTLCIFTVENMNELECLYHKVKYEIYKTYLKYESSVDVANSVIIQEILNGQEYGLDVINDLSCRYVATFVKQKLAMRSGETDSAITEDNEKIRLLGSQLSSALGHVANLDVDCFLDNDIPCILELNCRFGGGYPFSHLAGANIPLAIIQWLQGQTPDKTLFEIKYGVEGLKDICPVVTKQHP